MVYGDGRDHVDVIETLQGVAGRGSQVNLRDNTLQ